MNDEGLIFPWEQIEVGSKHKLAPFFQGYKHVFAKLIELDRIPLSSAEYMSRIVELRSKDSKLRKKLKIEWQNYFSAEDEVREHLRTVQNEWTHGPGLSGYRTQDILLRNGKGDALIVFLYDNQNNLTKEGVTLINAMGDSRTVFTAGTNGLYEALEDGNSIHIPASSMLEENIANLLPILARHSDFVPPEFSVDPHLVSEFREHYGSEKPITISTDQADSEGCLRIWNMQPGGYHFKAIKEPFCKYIISVTKPSSYEQRQTQISLTLDER
ncbi:hypothetical protein H8D36_03485 [archaeon]|nr:hypothetical protein [archaeon]